MSIQKKEKTQKPVNKGQNTIIQRKNTTINNQSYKNPLLFKDILFLQGVIGNQAVGELIGTTDLQQKTIQKRKNDNGLPDDLKSGIENLSGFSMDNVKVHRNSPAGK